MRKPSETIAVFALAAGALSLLPLIAPAAAVLSSLAGLLGLFLALRFPERYAGRRKILLGLGLCVVGMALFFAEGEVFWTWKIDQAYEQRIEISRLRLTEIAQALERYRQEKGAYPEVSGIMLTKDLLEPSYIKALSPVDGFDGAISVECHPESFTLRAFPPPRPRTGGAKAPVLTVTGAFHPAPAPPPPPTMEPPSETPAQGDLAPAPGGKNGTDSTEPEQGNPSGDSSPPPSEPPRVP